MRKQIFRILISFSTMAMFFVIVGMVGLFSMDRDLPIEVQKIVINRIFLYSFGMSLFSALLTYAFDLKGDKRI